MTFSDSLLVYSSLFVSMNAMFNSNSMFNRIINFRGDDANFIRNRAEVDRMLYISMIFRLSSVAAVISPIISPSFSEWMVSLPILEIICYTAMMRRLDRLEVERLPIRRHNIAAAHNRA